MPASASASRGAMRIVWHCGQMEREATEVSIAQRAIFENVSENVLMARSIAKESGPETELNSRM